MEDYSNISWRMLSENPAAIDLLPANPNKSDREGFPPDKLTNELSKYDERLIMETSERLELARMKLVLTRPREILADVWNIVAEFLTFDPRIVRVLAELIITHKLAEPIRLLSDGNHLLSLAWVRNRNISGMSLESLVDFSNDSHLGLVIRLTGHNNGLGYYRWSCSGANVFKAVFAPYGMLYWKWSGSAGMDPANRYAEPIMPDLLNLLYARLYSCLNSPDPLFAQFAAYRAH